MGLAVAASLDEYERSPVGRWVGGNSFVLWTASPTLAGSVYLARPQEQDITSLLRMATLVMHPCFEPPFDVIVDASRLDGLTAEDFETLATHVEFMKPFAPRVRKVGVVRPHGMLGATLAGLFYEAVQTSFGAALFTERREAFAWLARDDALDVHKNLDDIVSSISGTPAVLRKLRAYVAKKYGATNLSEAAQALGVATRSLQRELTAQGTTFRAEIERARIAAVERILLDDEVKISVVAQRTGFASASHLARSFRKQTGETPAEFRRRRPRAHL